MENHRKELLDALHKEQRNKKIRNIIEIAGMFVSLSAVAILVWIIVWLAFFMMPAA